MKTATILALIATLLNSTIKTDAATIIDTIPLWNGSALVSSWGGSGSTPTYGQTFIAPSDNFLESVTFEIQHNEASGIDYQAFVFAWNGITITGSAFFAGPISTVSPSASFQTINVDTESTALIAGQQYVAFLTTTTTGATTGNARWAQPSNTNPYPDGGFVFNNNSTFAGLSSGWEQNYLGTGGDLAFRLEFSSVPEPTTTALFIGGAAAAFAALRRRRK